MQANDERSSRSLGADLLKWTGRFLVLAGVIALASYGWTLADMRRSQELARRSLTAVPRQTASSTPPTHELRIGMPLADLSIPRIHLSAVVLHGSDERTLRAGLGHLEQTAWLGQSGNIVIAGHRDTFFRPLRNIRVGDDVSLDTPRGRFDYQVTSLRTVRSNDLSVLRPTPNATLTLITCYPFWVLGPAPDRFIVVASRVDAPTAVPIRGPAQPWRERAVTGTEAGAGATDAARARPPTSGAVVSNTETDDERAVRQVIERFRVTFNGHLTKHSQESAIAPVVWHACGVALEEFSATATCDAAIESSGRTFEHPTWTFTLAKAADGWTIRSIEMS